MNRQTDRQTDSHQLLVIKTIQVRNGLDKFTTDALLQHQSSLQFYQESPEALQNIRPKSVISTLYYQKALCSLFGI